MPIIAKLKTGWALTPYKLGVYISCAASLTLAVVIFLLQRNLPPVVPLFYGKPVGAGILTSNYGLLIAPGVSLIITLLNLLISFIVKDSFTKRILIIAALFVTILTAVTVIKIITLVGFF